MEAQYNMDARALVKIMFVKNSDIEPYMYLHIHCFEIKSTYYSLQLLI